MAAGKRQMTCAVQPSHFQSKEAATLTTLGMKIRKSIADGHTLSGAHSYNSQFFTAYAQHDQQDTSLGSRQQPFPGPRRVPLPSNMSGPPALSSDGSTFQTGSNVSEWGVPDVSTTTFSAPTLKRKLSDDGPVRMHEESEYHPYNLSYDQFAAQNGRLSFNEEF